MSPFPAWHKLDYYGFLVSLEDGYCQFSNFILLQYCVGDSDSFASPQKISNQFVSIHKNNLPRLWLGIWPPHAKSWLIGKDSDAGRDWGQEEKGTTEDEMAEWHHWLDGHESEWTLGVADGQGGLVCCSSWGHRVGHDWATELNWTDTESKACKYIAALNPQHINALLVLSEQTAVG